MANGGDESEPQNAEFSDSSAGDSGDQQVFSIAVAPF